MNIIVAQRYIDDKSIFDFPPSVLIWFLIPGIRSIPFSSYGFSFNISSIFDTELSGETYVLTLDFMPNEVGSFEDKYSIIWSAPPKGESIPKGLVELVILVIPGADESI